MTKDSSLSSMLRPEAIPGTHQAPRQLDTTPTPDPGFAFPSEMHDGVDQALRQMTGADEPEVFRSVRAKPVVRIIEDEKPKVVVNNPPVTPKSGADGVSIDLPSRFHYYDFKDLYVKPLRMPQMAKISKAHETGDLQKQVEAISSLLYTSSGDSTDLGLRLTMADYQAVLYWLRLSSFTKPQMRVSSFCANLEHQKEVEAGTKDKSTLEISTVVTKSDMRTIYLDKAPDPRYYQIVVDDTVIPFGPETLGDTIQFLAHDQWADEEFQYKSRIAAVIQLDKATGRKWAWDQRIQFVEEYVDPTSAIRALEFVSMMDAYGTVETVETLCKGCGSKGVTTLTCDPLMFLSPAF